MRTSDEVFSRFDDTAERFGLEKIKTIGDSYMVAGGLFEPRSDHVNRSVRMGLEMLAIVSEIAAKRGFELDIRVGIHTGPVVAGVIGKKRFIYDLWGDTVNTASRMESHGVPGRIQVTREVWEQIRDELPAEMRELDVKGKGRMQTFVLRLARPDAP